VIENVAISTVSLTKDMPRILSPCSKPMRWVIFFWLRSRITIDTWSPV
jgi:hypothetical protein